MAAVTSREIAPSGRLEKGASGWMQGTGPSHTQRDELGVGEIQRVPEPAQHGEDVQGGLEENVADKFIHRTR